MTSRTRYHRNGGFVGLCWCLKQIVEPFSYVNTCFCSKKCSWLLATWAKILYITSLRTAQESEQKEAVEDIIFRLPIPDWGPVYTYPYSFENATFFLRFQKNSRPLVAFSRRFRPSTRIRWINLKTITYPTAHAWRIRVRYYEPEKVACSNENGYVWKGPELTSLRKHCVSFNPLNPKIKIWILICCPYTFPTEVVERSW